MARMVPYDLDYDVDRTSGTVTLAFPRPFFGLVLDESELIELLAAVRDDGECPDCDGHYLCGLHKQQALDDAADDAASMKREAGEP